MTVVVRVPGHTRQDLAQERALAALTAAPGYERVAIHLRLIDLLRAATREHGAALNGATELRDFMHPACTDDARLDARELMRRVRQLPRRQARALVMLAAGFSYTEIAEREGVTTKAVDNALQDARRALR